MKFTPTAIVLLASLGATAAQADEWARVVSSTPIMQAVTVQQQVCAPQQVVTAAPRNTTGAGAVIGAIAGGAIGNSVGRGNGRAAATGLGIVGGALLGNQIEASGQTPGSQVQTVQQCGVQNVVENRVTGYDVRYEYAGKQYATQMTTDPGTHVRLQIVPVGGSTAVPPGVLPPPAVAPVIYPAR